MTRPLHVLTVCRHGAGRSQIAAAAIAAAWPTTAGPITIRVAGTAPTTPVRPIPDTVQLLLDEAALRPVQDDCRALTPGDLAWADAVVCFAEPQTWPTDLAGHPGLVAFRVEDGSGRSVDFQRTMRDQVLTHVRALLPHLRAQTADRAAREPRVAVIGDVGGHADVFIAALTAAGVDVPARHIPAGLAVVQVGDLVHKGPADAGCVRLADELLHTNPDSYVQLWGNHDAAYVGGPDVSSRPGVHRIDVASAATLRRWYGTGAARLAVAVDTAEHGPVLVTHGGLTAGLWHELGAPSTPQVAAAAINGLLPHPERAFRPGWLMTGVVDFAAGVTNPRTGAELAASWLAEGAMPFHQVHGHEGVWWWPAGTWHDDVPAAVRERSIVDADRRFCRVDIAGKTLLSVDWVLGPTAPDRAWEPLTVAGTLHR